LNDSLTRMQIQKLKGNPFEEVIEELTEIFEAKDERFRTMGMYFKEERDKMLSEEVKKVLGF